MKIKKSGVMLIIYIVLVAAAVTTILAFTLINKEGNKLKVGFITTGSIENIGASSANYRCIKKVCDEMGAELITISDVDETDGHCRSAVDEVTGKGAGLVLLNNSILSEQMKDLLPEYPNVTFYGANADYEADNFSAYSSRMYQARYLSGIIAGYYTKTNKLGFVAGYKGATTYQAINAFTLGARSVNPDIEVVVAWTGSLENEARETAMAEALIEEENVDLLTYYQEQPFVSYAAEKHGVASIGYYEPIENASEKYLTCVICDWTFLYQKILRRYMNGQSYAVKSEWTGIESGAIRLTDYSPLVSQEAIDKVNEAQKKMIESWNVFSGEIYDNNGVLRCASDELISDYTLLYEMDWLTEGVREYAE